MRSSPKYSVANCTTAWTEMLEKEPTPGGVVKFHTAHKLTLMAHGH